ncbi:DUF922 domain-containing Zn-dependent protease [Mucilaginibacter roseus]|uniref:DUF922 domain-containing Zn-dependent protease n=1 Tax=Mucilaginibacter roseus TaxID=1528868 RepID=A0ABS8U493_9SPHI|nr:DUF922 domain-containing protein [Mucilaginibacter roseus]MCD8741117.1 DUF922 domain-containing Zn-dependent protease [Mucilaginibacter roseus]
MALKFWKALLLIVVCTAGSSFAQQGYKTLTVNDFQGLPRRSNFAAVAYTNCSISYNYSVKRIRGVFRIDFEVSLLMNKDKSWLDRSRVKNPEMLAEILRHEQGHYDIAYLQQQEVLRAFNRTQFGRDYSMVIADIFNRIDAKYQQMNADYERETNHMQNREQQLVWNRYLQKKVSNLPPLTASM